MLLSHGHADHLADLPAFLGADALWRSSPRLLTSHSTIEATLLDATLPGSVAIEYVHDGARVIAEGFEAEFSSTTHQIPTLGVQVTMGSSRVVYSADTGPRWTFPSTFRDPDIAIVECTFEERNDVSSLFHLDAREVAELVNGISPSMTLVTHVPPGENGERRTELVRGLASDTQVIRAYAGLTIDLRRGMRSL